jgi:phosphomannomutase
MTTPAQIKFGTDGWRAIIAREFTFANVERVAQAYADFLQSQSPTLLNQLVSVGQISKEEAETKLFRDLISKAADDALRLVIVGYDRRFLSDSFALSATEILTGNGFRVALFSEPVPTPLVSWAVKDQQAIGGVVITASHNPPEFNGFKIKAPWGGSASPETTSEVERLVDTSPPKRSQLSSDPDGRQRLQQSVQTYRAQVLAYIDLDRIRQAELTVVVDPMHGSGGRWVESFLDGGALRAETIRANRDPLFGGVNPEPIDKNLAALKGRVLETGAMLGLATDGDADRLGAVNERGETMTMHEVVPLILLHLARERKMTGGVVRTFSQSVLTKRIAEAHGLKVHETPIGFKYIADLMLREDILIGAEESGGIGVKGHIPERDGILNSLLLLEAVVATGKTPSQMVCDLHQEFGEFYFGRRDLRMEVEQGQHLVARLVDKPPAKFAGYEVAGVETLDGTKLLFKDDSWLLFRQSGTEPMLRVYCEASSTAKMNAMLEEGSRLAVE